MTIYSKRALTSILAVFAALLAGACASVDDEPIPERRAPLLVLTNPAVIEQDTVVTGQGAPFFVQGYYAVKAGSLPTITATVREDGAGVRPLAMLAATSPSIVRYYQPPAAVRRARMEVQVSDDFNQVSGKGFWLRVVPLPAPSVSLATALPTTVAKSGSITIRARLTSLTDPPAEMRLYYYEPSRDGFGLVLLATVGEAALLAARQGSASVVDFPAVPVPASALPGSTVSLLVFGRTRHRMQTQAYANFMVGP